MVSHRLSTTFVPNTFGHIYKVLSFPLQLNIMVGTVNMGGVFNFFAYTFVRRSTSQNQQQRRLDKNEVTSSSATVSTVA